MAFKKKKKKKDYFQIYLAAISVAVIILVLSLSYFSGKSSVRDGTDDDSTFVDSQEYPLEGDSIKHESENAEMGTASSIGRTTPESSG